MLTLTALVLVSWGFQTNTGVSHTGQCSDRVSFKPMCPGRLESELSSRKWEQDEVIIILSKVSEGLVGFLYVLFALQGLEAGEL